MQKRTSYTYEGPHWTQDSALCYQLKQDCERCPIGAYGPCVVADIVPVRLKELGPPTPENTIPMLDGWRKTGRPNESRAVKDCTVLLPRSNSGIAIRVGLGL
jgi:hypothetical protein